MYMYLVVNNAHNRLHYPHLIGQRFVNPPLYPYPRASRPVQVRRYRVQYNRAGEPEPAKLVTLD